MTNKIVRFSTTYIINKVACEKELTKVRSISTKFRFIILCDTKKGFNAATKKVFFFCVRFKPFECREEQNN